LLILQLGLAGRPQSLEPLSQRPVWRQCFFEVVEVEISYGGSEEAIGQDNRQHLKYLLRQKKAGLKNNRKKARERRLAIA